MGHQINVMRSRGKSVSAITLKLLCYYLLLHYYHYIKYPFSMKLFIKSDSISKMTYSSHVCLRVYSVIATALLLTITCYYRVIGKVICPLDEMLGVAGPSATN